MQNQKRMNKNNLENLLIRLDKYSDKMSRDIEKSLLIFYFIY